MNCGVVLRYADCSISFMQAHLAPSFLGKQSTSDSTFLFRSHQSSSDAVFLLSLTTVLRYCLFRPSGMVIHYMSIPSLQHHCHLVYLRDTTVLVIVRMR
jgi:hypothetical protein